MIKALLRNKVATNTLSTNKIAGIRSSKQASLRRNDGIWIINGHHRQIKLNLKIKLEQPVCNICDGKSPLTTF